VVVIGEDGDESAEAAFLHLDGGGHDVQCALLQGGFGHVGEDLWAYVIDGGFENGDGALGGVGCVADVEAEDVGEPFGVAGSCTVADLLDAHLRLWNEGRGESADNGCSGGRDELFFDVCGVGWEAAEEVGGGGGGDGEAAVGAVDHASADVEGGAEPLVDGKGVDACAGGYDVDDGVDCAYFVEVDFFNVDVVDFGFAGTEEFEGLDAEGFDFWDKAGGLDQFADGGEGASVGVRVPFFGGVKMAGFAEMLGFGVVGVGFGGALVLEVVLEVVVGVRLAVVFG